MNLRSPRLRVAASTLAATATFVALAVAWPDPGSRTVEVRTVREAASSETPATAEDTPTSTAAAQPAQSTTTTAGGSSADLLAGAVLRAEEAASKAEISAGRAEKAAENAETLVQTATTTTVPVATTVTTAAPATTTTVPVYGWVDVLSIQANGSWEAVLTGGPVRARDPKSTLKPMPLQPAGVLTLDDIPCDVQNGPDGDCLWREAPAAGRHVVRLDGASRFSEPVVVQEYR